MSTIISIEANAPYAILNSKKESVNYNEWIWKQGEEVEDGDGSFRPALFDISGTEDILSVTMDAGQPPPGKEVKLEGYLGGGKVFTSPWLESQPGEMTVSINRVPGATGFHQVQGDIRWELSSRSPQKHLHLQTTTRLELYWIYDTPGGMYSPWGPWAPVLRIIASLGDNGRTKEKLTADITAYCHDRTGKKYDSELGASYFGTNGEGGYFNLEAYLAGDIELCNCYDQGGAVQAFLGAAGLDSTWNYMSPYGYIDETRLIGWGPCNNPFFKEEVKDKTLPENHPDRTKFGCHVFVRKDDRILDATVGPHQGTEDPETYIDNSIDSETVLYTRDLKKKIEQGKNATNYGPGTVDSIQEFTGIESVYSSTAPQTTTAPNKNAEQLGVAPPNKREELAKFVVKDWSEFNSSKAVTESGLSVIREQMVPGKHDVLKQWILEKDGHKVAVNLFISSHKDCHQMALRRFKTILGSFTHLDHDHVDYEEHQDSTLSISLKQKKNFFLHSIFNLTIFIRSLDDHIDVKPLALWFLEEGKKNIARTLLLHRPKLPRLIHGGLKVALHRFRDDLKIFLGKPVDEHIDTFMMGTGFSALQDSDGNFEFKSLLPPPPGELLEKAKLTLLNVDSKTLITHEKTVKVEMK